MMNQRRAFTMMELLVVISIIAILGSVIIAVSNSVRNSARINLTTQRIEQIHQGILAYTAGQGPFGVVTLQGLLNLNTNSGTFGQTTVAPGDTLALSNAANAKCNWQAPLEKADGKITDEAVAGYAYLSQFNPRKTVELLHISGILSGETLSATVHPDFLPLPTEIQDSSKRYTMIRGRNSPWNDAWGYPFVVGVAVFQTKGNSTQRISDLDAYGKTRAVYISIGCSANTTFSSGWPSPGNVAGSAWVGTPADTNGALYWSWKKVCEVNATANKNSGDFETTNETWRSETHPNTGAPWHGIRRMGYTNGAMVFQSEPLEIK